MNTNYLRKAVFSMAFLALSVSANAQTPNQINKIRSKSNLNMLQSIREDYSKKAISNKEEAMLMAQQKGWKTKIRTNDGRFMELERVVDGRPIYYTTYNVDAAESTRTNHLHSGGSLGLNVMGQNMTAHVWDGGVARASHQEYDGAGGSNRFSIGDGSSSLNFHAAHVTGTIIASGVQAAAKGMAPQARAIGYDWNSDTSEAAAAAANGMLVSNHSYGFAPRDQFGNVQLPDYFFGGYIDVSSEWDAIMFNAPNYLMVVAAGNDGNDNSLTNNPTGGSGFDKLTGHSTAKNNLVVANAQDANVASNGDLISVSINNSSSEGPTDDFRIKPDITGNGTGVYSTYENSNTAYASITGTSMASPNVAGSLLVLQEHFDNVNGDLMRAATLKGLVLHTADDVGATGPDAVYGWGLLNTKKAAEAISDEGEFSRIEELTLSNGQSYTISVDSDGSSPLMASISWTDRPGTPTTSTNSTTPVLVNDLDIRLFKNGIEYFPYELTGATSSTARDNNVDPFERVDIGNASGSYTITVTHKGNLVGGSQNFSLVVTGISGDGGTNPEPPTPDTCETLPYSESFESGAGWTQVSGDDGNWLNDASGTPSSGTGPSTATDGSFYMFLEASTNGSAGQIGANATAILESPCFDLSSVSSATFSFQNHMYGTSVGSLELEASTNGSSWTTLWSSSGDQGNQWNEESVNLAAYLGGDVQLRFVGTTGSSWSSDIAIDDLELTASGSTADTTAPSRPVNLVASDIAETTATISWSASTDNVSVAGYYVYQDSNLLGQTTNTSAAISSLTEDTTYTFSVSAFDTSGNESASSSVTITTDAAPGGGGGGGNLTYCDSEGTDSSFEWIDYVALGGMTNTSGDDGGYADYTNNVAVVAPGSTNTLTISAGFASTSYTEYWKIWIDFDQSGSFEDDEVIVSGSSSSAANLTANATIPTNATLGETTMRVSMKYDAEQTACETFEYGEVEDYTVNITNNANFANYAFKEALTTESVSTSLLGFERSVGFNVYPNPSSNFVTINLENSRDLSFEINDVYGQLIVKSVTSNGVIDISTLQTGIYFVIVNDGQKTFTTKLIKQ